MWTTKNGLFCVEQGCFTFELYNPEDFIESGNKVIWDCYGNYHLHYWSEEDQRFSLYVIVGLFELMHACYSEYVEAVSDLYRFLRGNAK